MSASELKTPPTAPHSKESEMMVLGCMLSSSDSLNTACDRLDDSDFYFTEHRFIFSALKTLYKADKPADVHLLSEELKSMGKLQASGGVSYLAELVQYAGTSAFTEEYADIVKDKAILRRMIDAAQIVEKKAIQNPKDVHGLLDDAQREFFVIGQRVGGPVGTLVSELISGVKSETQLPFLKEVEKRQELFAERGEDNLHGITGLSTSLADLDRMINGLGSSNLVIVAGRPAMGKTAFAINVAENAWFKNGKSVGFFSLEMSSEQVLGRMIASLSNVEGEKISRGSLNGNEYQRVVGVCEEIQKLNTSFVIDDTPGLKITDLRARARRMKEAYDIDLLVIDYLQLISGSGQARSMESRQSEISEISRLLKTLARELNIPILCPSQLSRKVEERTGHRPVMSDLRESGSIEQDADVVMFLLRREYYDPQDKPGLAEIIVGKNRHGKTGDVHVAFRKEIGQFANYTPEDPFEENDF